MLLYFTPKFGDRFVGGMMGGGGVCLRTIKMNQTTTFAIEFNEMYASNSTSIFLLYNLVWNNICQPFLNYGITYRDNKFRITPISKSS